MPKPKKAVRERAQLLDLAELGLPVALADLAEALGLTPQDAAALPDRLREAGLPAKVPGPAVAAAHRLFRDRADAVMYRVNWLGRARELRLHGQDAPLEPPALSPPEARAQAEEIKAEEARAKDVEAKRAAQADARRTSSTTQREARVIAQRAAATPKPLAPRRAVAAEEL